MLFSLPWVDYEWLSVADGALWKKGFEARCFQKVGRLGIGEGGPGGA